MRFGPGVQNRTAAALIDMPAVEGVLRGPASRGRDEQVSHLQKLGIGLQHLVNAASAEFDLKMGEVGLQALRQGLSLVAADRCGTERMATDIRPTQGVRVDQHNPADSSLG